MRYATFNVAQPDTTDESLPSGSLSCSRRKRDAWLLDKQEGLAAQLARDGDPEPIHIEETDANFAIEWKGRHRIKGPAFVYVDRKTGGTRTILGYPTQRMEHAGRGR
jgi:hypothetical protein